MDTSAKNIVFDENGVCNYCSDFTVVLDKARLSVADSIAAKDQFIAKVKESGRGKQYDCIVGVSGGVDSSYALYLAVKHGLRPLAVHLDNGWNSELATHNIANLVKSLGVDLHTHVIDWDENRDLQRSFFAAHVVDIELLMDNAMQALNYQLAAKYGLTYILAGTNMSTEGMSMPPGWNHFKRDAKNIRAIHRRFGTVPIKTHRLLSVLGYLWFERARKIKWISFLDYFPYVKSDAVEILKAECAYKPYPYKHYESVFTRFYQAYILPRKFGYDKRRLHLSTLIVSGQMSRDEAIEMLGSDPYPDPKQMEQDKTFVLKKLGFTEQSFDEYIAAPEIPHAVYGTEETLQNNIAVVYRTLFKSNWLGFHFENLKRKIKHVVANHPIILFQFYRVISPNNFNNACVVRNGVEIVIEGFPRSANSFAVIAFNLAQGRKVPCAHHLHVEAQILKGIQLGIPVIVLIRHPADAISSLLIRDGGSAKEHARRYIKFYSNALLVREYVVFAEFHQVTKNFGEVIRKVNDKFSKDYKIFKNSKENIDAVFQRLDEINQCINDGKLTHLARPVEHRNDKPTSIDMDDPYLIEAVSLYEKIIADAELR